MDLVAAGLVALLAHLAVVWLEEPATRRRLGPDYDCYCARVPRWIPRWSVAQDTSDMRFELQEYDTVRVARLDTTDRPFTGTEAVKRAPAVADIGTIVDMSTGLVV